MNQTVISSQNVGVKPPTIASRTSKKDKAKELYKKYHTLNRNQIIQKFIEELDMPENSARTYVSVCAKELNETLGKEYKTRNVNRTNSKRERAYQLYADNVTKGRKEIIEILKSTLGMSHNSAATHCSLAHKAYKAGEI